MFCRSLRQSVRLLLGRSQARMEFAVTSKSLSQMLQIDLDEFGETIRRENLLVQVQQVK